jgi:hypothetical protein
MIPNKQTILTILGKQPYKNLLLVDSQDTKDIIEAILNKHESCGADYDKFSYLFDGGSIPQICERLFIFCKQNLQYYIEDTKAQEVSRPSTILTRGYSDCKCYALFIGGVLDSLKRSGEKINWVFRFASYKLLKKRVYHVFIVVNYQGQEIFIDPVFKSFNYKGKPAMWVEDYKVSAEPAAIAGMACDTQGKLNVFSDHDCSSCSAVGATGQQTGQVIMKLAPALAEVPVAALIVEGVGVALELFGSKYTTSTQVRWLTCYYERMVLNIACRSDNTVNAADSVPAQQWFSYVLGVPIYDQLRVHTLKGTDSSTGASLNQSYATRATNYLAYPDAIAAGVTYQQALEAAMLSDNLNWFGADGSWANMTAAPALIDNSAAATLAPQSTATTSLSSIFSNKWVLIAIAGVGLLLLTSPSKKKKHHAK